jgi:predicted enzyme related to lactoylglutathione lyase
VLNLKNVNAVLPVSDHAAAVAWYAKWLGRNPDVVPVEGVAEWQIAENAWIQVAQAPDPTLAGKTSVVLGVNDIDAQVSTLSEAGVPTSDVNDYGFIKITEVSDPDGNKINFVWENPNFDPTAG